MEFGEIFKDALKYPLSDFQSLLIVGVIILISECWQKLINFEHFSFSPFFVFF